MYSDGGSVDREGTDPSWDAIIADPVFAGNMRAAEWKFLLELLARSRDDDAPKELRAYTIGFATALADRALAAALSRPSKRGR
jgi:hypothetical protein